MSPTADTVADRVLVGRQASHFTRVVRMVAAELGVPLRLSANTDLMSLDPADYGGHPALRLPVLLRGEDALYGCLNICRVLAQESGRRQDFVLPEDGLRATQLNACEIVLNAMNMQTDLVIHEVVAKRPADALSAKRRQGLSNSLQWLDARIDALVAELPARVTSFLEVSLFCLMTHIPYRNPMDLSNFARLDHFTRRFGERASALATPFGFDAPRR